MTTCLIFGGNGFLGSHIAKALLEKGYAVSVFDNFQTGMANLDPIKSKIQVIQGDFHDEKDVSSAIKGVDYIFHYISTTVPSTAKNDPVYDIASNVIGSIKLFQHAVDNKVKRIIFSSSGGTVYGEPQHLPIRETDPANPTEPYAISKVAIERYLQYFHDAYGLDYTIFRYSNPYGEGQNRRGKQGVIPIFLNAIKQGQHPVVFGDGSMIRDYIYIKDAVAATMAVFEKTTSEKIFNVGSGQGTSINDLLDIMSAVAGRKITAEYVKPSGPYVQKFILDTTRIRDVSGWKPSTSLRDGLKITWDWISRCP